MFSTYKHFLFLLLGIILLSNCQSTQHDLSVIPENLIDKGTIPDIENYYAENRVNYGTPIGEIQFTTNNDTIDFKNGVVPWADIATPDSTLKLLTNPNEVVLSSSTVSVVIDYPLTNPSTYIISSKDGFTRAELFKSISTLYFKIYDEEAASTTIPVTPLKNRTSLLNRNHTNGKHGIWGHDIEDLSLTDAAVYRTDKDSIILTLNIDS